MNPFDVNLGMLCRNLKERNDLAVFETCIVFARYSYEDILVKSRQNDGYITAASIYDFEYFFKDEWTKLNANN